MKKYSQFIIQHATVVAIIGTVLALIGSIFTAKLYINLHPDIEELLPETVRSVKDFSSVAERLNSVESMAILVMSDNPSHNREFTERLGKRLKQIPKDIVSLSTYRINDEADFFKARKALFIDKKDLLDIQKFLNERIDYEKRYAFSIFPEADRPPKPTLDIDTLKKKYQNRYNEYGHFPGGYYATEDEKVYMLIAYLPGKGLVKAHRMKAAIEEAVRDTNPSQNGVSVKYTGNVQNLIEESAALVEDLEFTTVVVFVLVIASLIVYFRSAWGTFALMASLFMGTFWTFGVSYFLVNYLNANTAFLASIVIGNGINFGVILLARILEEKRKNQSTEESTEISMIKTAPATIVAAAASGLSYGSLILTNFRGFNQFGLIGLVGMTLCWISAYTLLPAYLVCIDRMLTKGWQVGPAPHTLLADKFALWITRRSTAICGVVAVVSIASLVSFVRFTPNLIETDLSKLKDIRSQKTGSGSLYHYIDDIFGHSLSPLVVLPENEAQAREIASQLKEKRDSDPNTVLSTVQTLYDFVPEEQSEKIQIVREISSTLKPSMLKMLSSDERKFAKDLLAAADTTPYNLNELPQLILDRFRQKDGSVGKIVILDKKIDKTGKDDANAIISFINTVREVADAVSPNSLVAGQLPIISDMIQAIRDDGPKATLFALLAVVALLVLLFRNTYTIFLAVFSLSLGILWMFAFIVGLRYKINFLNFIAIPITFGIGVDYGINLFQRFRSERNSNILDVIKHTGGAIAMCSLTTIIGYGSLLLAGNQAFVSFGTLAVLGEFTCLFAAIVALPAVLVELSKRRARKGSIAPTNPTASNASLN